MGKRKHLFLLLEKWNWQRGGCMHLIAESHALAVTSWQWPHGTTWSIPTLCLVCSIDCDLESYRLRNMESIDMTELWNPHRLCLLWVISNVDLFILSEYIVVLEVAVFNRLSIWRLGFKKNWTISLTIQHLYIYNGCRFFSFTTNWGCFICTPYKIQI